VVTARAAICRAWITTREQPGPPPGFPATGEWYQLQPRLYRTLDVFGTGAPLLLVETPELPAWAPADGLGPGCTLMVPFQDPENVGAVIRSAVAFGAGDVVLLRECGHPYHPRAIRASGGAVFQARLRSGPSLAELPADLPLVPLSVGGRSIASFEFPERFALVPGVEGPGLPTRLRAHALSIPISDRVESLNAATAAAVALFAWRSRVSNQEKT